MGRTYWWQIQQFAQQERGGETCHITNLGEITFKSCSVGGGGVGANGAGGSGGRTETTGCVVTGDCATATISGGAGGGPTGAGGFGMHGETSVGCSYPVGGCSVGDTISGGGGVGGSSFDRPQR